MIKQHSDKKTNYIVSLKTTIIVLVLFTIIGAMSSGISDRPAKEENKFNDQSLKFAEENSVAPDNDSTESVAAFMKVYQVLVSPRCMNCHPSGDVPLQGDDNHLHEMTPNRGSDGKGVYAMKCTNCHQSTNVSGPHQPPGDPNWHLPPANMKMIFQGKTAHQLAKQIMDPKQNGRKNKQQLIDHADDALVLIAWNPGDGRTQPPISHEEFKQAWITWISKGGYAPPAK